jgi:hypothetical protein
MNSPGRERTLGRVGHQIIEGKVKVALTMDFLQLLRSKVFGAARYRSCYATFSPPSTGISEPIGSFQHLAIIDVSGDLSPSTPTNLGDYSTFAYSGLKLWDLTQGRPSKSE